MLSGDDSSFYLDPQRADDFTSQYSMSWDKTIDAGDIKLPHGHNVAFTCDGVPSCMSISVTVYYADGKSTTWSPGSIQMLENKKATQIRYYVSFYGYFYEYAGETLRPILEAID